MVDKTKGGVSYSSFQFLGIPPKGELYAVYYYLPDYETCFQFLGIPPKGELDVERHADAMRARLFPISRDPPEGGTPRSDLGSRPKSVSNF